MFINFFKKIFKRSNIIKESVIFGNKYRNNVSIRKVLIDDFAYVMVIVNWRSYTRFRISYDFFLKKKNLFLELQKIITSGSYRDMKYSRIDVPPISSYINLGFKENVCKKFLLICTEKQVPIIELSICEYKDEYYIIFNLQDSMRGNRRKISMEDGLRIANALLYIADDA